MSTGTLVAIIAPIIGVFGAGGAGVLAVCLTGLRSDKDLRGDVRGLETRIEQRIAESDARNAERFDKKPSASTGSSAALLGTPNRSWASRRPWMPTARNSSAWPTRASGSPPSEGPWPQPPRSVLAIWQALPPAAG